jgi:RNA polymerase sigma-70 factor, ECF subfamily
VAIQEIDAMLANNQVTVTDQQLIEQTLSGNAEAFGQLVRRYQDQLFTSLRHVMGSPDDAEDVVQDAFVQAYRKLDTFRQHCAFYTWLYRIALNLVYTRSRRRRIRANLARTRPVMENDQPDPHGTPDDELQRREAVSQIGQALQALSDEHRTILVMRGVEGFDYDTIAELLAVSPGTVRSRLHRARAQLRDQLSRFACCPS